MQPAFEFDQEAWKLVDIAAPCTRCGAQVTGQVPAFVQPTYQAFCEPCTEAANRALRAEEAEREFEQASARFDGSLPKAYREKLHEPAFARYVQLPKGMSDPLALAGKLARHVGNVCLGGPAGTGKTTLAVAALRQAFELAPRAQLPRFFHASKLGIIRIQTPAGQGESAMVLEAMSCRIALLDDLGAERHTVNNAIPDIVQQRHADGLPTWITTGLSSEQIAQRYGDGTRRRLFEGAHVLRLGRAAS